MYSGSGKNKNLPMTIRQPQISNQTKTTSDWKSLDNMEDHGLICKNGCNCPIMNGATILEDKKSQIWTYLKRCLKIIGSKVRNIIQVIRCKRVVRNLHGKHFLK